MKECKLCHTTYNLDKIIGLSDKDLTICSRCYTLMKSKELLNKNNRVIISKLNLDKIGV